MILLKIIFVLVTYHSIKCLFTIYSMLRHGYRIQEPGKEREVGTVRLPILLLAGHILTIALCIVGFVKL